MYRSVYHLREKPFAVSPDLSFLWLGAKQDEALAVLRRTLFARKGFALLTGEAGVGKTMLMGTLIEGFPRDVAWAVVGDTVIDRLEFYNAIARGFGFGECTSKVQFLLQFSAFLHKSREEGRKAVLLVEDCHRLRQEMLEELRQLVNIEEAGTQLVDILFIGRSEFLDTLRQPDNRAIRQLLGPPVVLEPLSRADTGNYILHRLHAAGMEEELFTAKAIEEIHRGARGIPRLINMICNQALIVGAAEESRPIGLWTVEKALDSLNLATVGRPAGEEEADDKPRFSLRGTVRAAAAVRDLLLPSRPGGQWVLGIIGALLVGSVGLSFLLPEDGRKPVHQEGRPAAGLRVEKEPSHRVSPAPIAGLNPIEPIGNTIELNMPEPTATAGKEVAEVIEREKPAEPAEPPVPSSQGAAADEPQPAAGEGVVASVVPQVTAEQHVAEQKDENGITASPQGVEAEKEAVVKLTATLKKVIEPPPSSSPAPIEAASIKSARIVLPLQPNSLQLTAEAEKDLHDFVERLQGHPKVKLLVKGYVSSATNSPENVKLSEERAMVVQRLLVDRGIEPARITVKGMGNQEPIANNDTREGRAKNRRVEIVIDDGR